MALDFAQIIKKVYDTASNRLRVDSSLTLSSATIEVNVDHVDDSIKVGDGTDFLAVNADGSINVLGPLTDAELRATPVPISASSLPLPTGAATETTLSALNTKVVISDTGNVTIVSSVLPTGAATATLQTTANISLASIDSKLTSPLSVTGPLTDAQLRATPVPVSGTVSANPTDYALQLDDTSTPNVTYVGIASIGSATASAVWRIKRIDETSGLVITWADSNNNFDNIWDNRTGLTYG